MDFVRYSDEAIVMRGLNMVYDLSMTISTGTATYPADPPILVKRVADLADAGCNVTSLAMGAHSGTHADLPLHYISGGTDAASAALDRFFGRAVVVEADAKPGQPISLAGIDVRQIKKDDILLIRTGWEIYAGTTAFFENFPYLGPEAARLLIDLGVKAVGTDLPSVDGLNSQGEIHKALLARQIMIIEALVNLKQLAGRECFFCAVPLKIEQGDGSPVRAFAVV
jgi:arylformamidase